MRVSLAPDAWVSGELPEYRNLFVPGTVFQVIPEDWLSASNDYSWFGEGFVPRRL